MNSIASFLVAFLVSVPALWVARLVPDATAMLDDPPTEDCLTGATQCKPKFTITGICGAEVRLRAGGVQVPGSCKCDPDCKKSTECNIGGQIEIRVVTSGTILLTGSGCFAAGTWVEIGGVGTPGNPLKVECGQGAANFVASCYTGICGGGNQQFVGALYVSAACSPCNGTCPH